MAYKIKHIDIETSMKGILMREEDAEVLGLRMEDRVKVSFGNHSVTARVHITDTLVERGQIGVFENTYKELDLKDDSTISILPTGRPQSVDFIKKKMSGHELTKDEIYCIVEEITKGALSNIEITAYVAAIYTNPMSIREIEDLTRAMIDTGETIEFDRGPVFDFHSLGGSPGNKITLLIVPIVAANGLFIPKTCSRAISSAGGTADIFETVTSVCLSADKIKEVAEFVGGMIAWGGAVNIAPSDDIIIRVEYPLALDPHAQVIGSIMAKKKATGAEYLLLDIPMGKGTKVETMEIARKYASDFIEIGRRLGIQVECVVTYGGQPIGTAVGPALECREAFQALEGKEVSSSLIGKACALAGILLEMGKRAQPGEGRNLAEETIANGKALEKMKEIVKAQGGSPDVTSESIHVGKHTFDVVAHQEGYVSNIGNREIVKVVRAAGAPHDKGAGILFKNKLGHKVKKGDVIYTIFAENARKLEEAKAVALKLQPVDIEGMVLERVPGLHYYS